MAICKEWNSRQNRNERFCEEEDDDQVDDGGKSKSEGETTNATNCEDKQQDRCDK